MAKWKIKGSGKNLTDDEIGTVVMMKRNGKSGPDIAKAVSGVSGEMRTLSSIHGVAHNIKSGRYAERGFPAECLNPSFEFDYELPEIKVETTKKKSERATVNSYSDEENLFIWRNRTGESAIPYKILADRFNVEFNASRSKHALNIQFLRIKTGEVKVPFSLEGLVEEAEVDSSEEGSDSVGRIQSLTEGYKNMAGISNALGQFDKDVIMPYLQERDDLLYQLMSSQADAIRNYEILSKYGKTAVLDLLGLDDSERQQLVELLKSKDIREVKNVEILAVPRYDEPKPAATLILPVYIKDTVKPKSILSTELGELTYAILASKSAGFRESTTKPFKVDFRDLVSYNVSVIRGQPNFDGLSEKITSEVRKAGKGYGGVNVSVRQDDLFSRIFLREE